MKRLMGVRLLLAFLGVVGLALAARADTLEMKDRRIINGKFLGGTQNQVRFQVDGKVELYPVADIVAITFGGDAMPERSDLASTGSDPSRRARPAASGTAASEPVTVPAGTRILVRMIDTVDSAKNKVGDRFRASLEEDLTVNTAVVARKGSDVYGRLAEAKEAGHVSGKSDLKLELTGILINNQVQPVLTGEYEVSGKSRGSNTAKKVGGGAAVGAIIGAIAGGGKGAAIGAGVGAGAGTAIQVLTKGEQVRVPSETLLEFRIDQPFTVKPATASAR